MATKTIEKLDITFAKGLAITLVVIGHILAGGASQGNEWFTATVDYIYLFHMPFFIFLSGYVFFRPGRMERINNAYLPYIKGNAVRLLLPFIAIGALIVVGKIIMQNIVHVDNVPSNPFRGFLDLIWHTKESPSVFLWYIYAIFVYGALSPLIYRVLKERMVLWVLLSAALVLLPPIHYFYLNKLTLFFVFFCLAGWAIHNEEKYLSFIKDKTVFLVALVAFITSIFLFEADLWDKKWHTLLTGALSIIVLHNICLWVVQYKNKMVDLFLFLGRHCYVIYLFNTICIGVTKGVIFLIMSWHGALFFLVAPVLILAGILGPLIAEWLILYRIPFIKKNILGVK